VNDTAPGLAESACRRLLALAVLAWRSAWRSRLLLTLIGLLALGLAGLPRTLAGDGTLAGRLKVLIHYNLGLSAMLLAAATVWTAAGAISLEVQGRQMNLVAVKPVPMWQVWLGKWLGITALNLALLAAAGAVTFGYVERARRDPRVPAAQRRLAQEQILTARRQVRPRPEPIAQTVAARWRQWLAQGSLPPGVSPAEALAQLRIQALNERAIVPPEGRRQWVFDPPRRGWTAALQGPIMARARCRASALEPLPVKGTWSVAGPDGAVRTGELPMEQGLGARYGLTLPRSAFAAAEPVTLRFANGPRAVSGTAVFDWDEPVELLLPEGGFAGNLARALLIVALLLSLLAALGLTAGALFSFPVAAFVSAGVLALALLSRTLALSGREAEALLEHDHGPAAPPSLLERAGANAGAALGAALEPVLGLDPLGRLADGILLSWGTVGRAACWAALGYGGALAALGSGGLRRRELGTPGL